MICSIWVWINSFQVWIPPHLVWNPTCLVWNYTILWYETPLNRYEIEGLVWLHTVVWNLKYMVWNSTHGMKLQLWYETGMKVKIVWNHTRVWNTDIMVWNEYWRVWIVSCGMKQDACRMNFVRDGMKWKQMVCHHTTHGNEDYFIPFTHYFIPNMVWIFRMFFPDGQARETMTARHS